MSKQKITKIRVQFNIWGTYACFIGKTRVESLPSEFQAKFWLMEQLEVPFQEISDKSYFDFMDVALFENTLFV